MAAIRSGSVLGGVAAAGRRPDALGGRKFFFGHQSVGFDIVDGIRTLSGEHYGKPLRVVETADPVAFEAPVFAHARIGKNGDPLSKIDEFSARIEAGIGGQADFAFMKLCYVDITAGTDIEDLLDRYTTRFARLRSHFPKTIFVHFTVPLTTVRGTLRTRIGEAIGIRNSGRADNAARNLYNERLLETYEGKEPVFDLAGLEASGPDGCVYEFLHRGRRFRAMNPANTRDGGHLNITAKETAANSLLQFLAAVTGAIR